MMEKEEERGYVQEMMMILTPSYIEICSDMAEKENIKLIIYVQNEHCPEHRSNQLDNKRSFMCVGYIKSRE